MLFIVTLLIIIVVIALLSMRVVRQHKPKPIQVLSVLESNPTDTIFVSIPCYEDSAECVRTICDMFTKAACPQRVFVGICEQITLEPADGVAILPFLNQYDREARLQGSTIYSSNIRVITVDVKEARGPMYARGIIERTMYRNEKYFMTIDSHMRFVSGWDQAIIQAFEETDDKMAMLTTLPASFDRERWMSGPTPPELSRLPTFAVVDRPDRHQFPILSFRTFRRTPRRSYQTPFYCPTFSFALGTVVDRCPTDLTFEYLFFPEMMVRSAQLFVRGFTFYTPSCVVCYHCDNRRYRPLFWDRMSEAAYERHALSVDRARSLFHVNVCRTCGVQRSEHNIDRLDHRFALESQLSDQQSIKTKYLIQPRPDENLTTISLNGDDSSSSDVDEDFIRKEIAYRRNRRSEYRRKRSIVTRAEPVDGLRKKQKSHSSRRQITYDPAPLVRSLAEFTAACGVVLDAEATSITAEAHLGVISNRDISEEELVMKFDGIRQYNNMLAKLNRKKNE